MDRAFKGAIRAPWISGFVVAILLLILLAFSSGTVAVIIGFGLGSMLSPPLFLGVLIIGLSADRWWKPIVIFGLLVIANRAMYLKPLTEKPIELDIFQQISALGIGLLLISIICGFRMMAKWALTR